MSSSVTTVLGPVPSEKLGTTLMHEHLVIDICRVSRNGDAVLNDLPLAMEEAARFRSAGGATIVELTNRHVGRQPKAIAAIAQRTELNVIMGCGWYREPFYDVSIYEETTDQIAEEIVRDIEEGIDGTGIRAGIIGEIGSDLGYVSPAEERVFRAAARAHKRTGLTVTTYAVGARTGLDQLDILEHEEANLSRVVVGHCDSVPDPDYHEAVARRGAFVGFDSIGRGFIEHELQYRVDWITRLIEKGFLRQILLSHDTCFRSQLRAFGGPGYDYILTRFVPRLLESGLSQEQIATILVENPRSALTGEVG